MLNYYQFDQKRGSYVTKHCITCLACIYAFLFISVLGAAVTFAAAEQCFFDTGTMFRESWCTVFFGMSNR